MKKAGVSEHFPLCQRTVVILIGQCIALDHWVHRFGDKSRLEVIERQLRADLRERGSALPLPAPLAHPLSGRVPLLDRVAGRRKGRLDRAAAAKLRLSMNSSQKSPARSSAKNSKAFSC